MQHTVIPSWYQREGYIKAMADLIEKELRNFDCPEQVVNLVFLCFLTSGIGSCFFLVELPTVFQLLK